MELARFNIFWFAWLICPIAIMMYATYKSNRKMLVIGIVCSILLTYLFSNLAVHRKWNIRLNVAKTQNEIEYATADGANKAFTLIFIAPSEAILFTSLWGVIGTYWWRLKRKHQ